MFSNGHGGTGNGSSGHSMVPVYEYGARELVGYKSYLPDGFSGVCSLDVGPQHLNGLGMLHGGIVSMLLDNGCGIAVRTVLGDVDAAAVTVSVGVNFIDSASEGLVTGGGDVVGGDRSMKFAEAELRDAAGRLLATCNATFRVFTK